MTPISYDQAFLLGHRAKYWRVGILISNSKLDTLGRAINDDLKVYIDLTQAGNDGSAMQGPPGER